MTSDPPLSSYHDAAGVQAEVDAGRHREAIGGLWEELGALQFRQLLGAGLRPSMAFLDVGCGCLRAGVHLIPYLDAGNYYGIDLNASLLDAGWERELTPAMRERLPRSNLRATGDFDVAPFGRRFEMGIAQSLFTHLPIDHVRRCLERLAPWFESGGRLYASFFECPVDHPTAEPLVHQPGGVTTQGAADPYHYRFADLETAARGVPWDVAYIGDWGHPRAQRLVAFRRR